jgi:hypothetical protein
MSIEKRYEARDINWVLIPDLIEKVKTAILDEQDQSFRSMIALTTMFSFNSNSERVVVDDPNEFLELLKKADDHKSTINIVLSSNQGSTITIGANVPKFTDFALTFDTDNIELLFTRPSIHKSLDLIRQFEEVLQLKPFQAAIIEEGITQRRRTVFIAHAFDNAGRSYAFQLTKFLSLLGFEVATGDGFAPERVSSKVKRRLSAQEIVMVVISQKDDYTWLIQEAAGADFSKKPIILLIQDGVEFTSGILGDLEYIRFPSDRIAEAFTPILEGLRELGFHFS